MWSGVRLATRQRMAFDLLLDRSLPDAVADLNASLRAALVYFVLDGLCPAVQYRVDHRGRLVGRADLAFPERRLAVEYHGAWHGALLQVGPDRDRLNRLHPAGWDVVFITAQHLREPRRLVCTVRAVLQARRAG
jgi:very-short-patch-repair endonuclease